MSRSPRWEGGRRRCSLTGFGPGGSPGSSPARSDGRSTPANWPGTGGRAEVRDELREWDYGAYEGQTTAGIRGERPGWILWTDGAPGGETAEEVGARVDPLVTELRTARRHVAVFGHGHLLRVLTARWIELAPAEGRRFVLGTGTISVLGFERETPVILQWNHDGRPDRPAGR